MTNDFLSPYINFSIRPRTDDVNELDFEIWSNEINLAKLPGLKHIEVTLTVGSFADGNGDGPTHHEEGYTSFKPKPNGSRLTLQIKDLKPAEEWVEGTKANLEPDNQTEVWRQVEFGGSAHYFRVLNGGSRIIKGVAALVLENQKVALYDNSDQFVASLQGCEVVLARVHFALIPVKQGKAFVLEQRDNLAKRRVLLTVTPQSSNGPQALCIVHRSDLAVMPPNGWATLPGAFNYMVNAPLERDVPELRLEFHLLDNWLSLNENGKHVKIKPAQVSMQYLASEDWIAAPLCSTKAPDGSIAICTSVSNPLAPMWKEAT